MSHRRKICRPFRAQIAVNVQPSALQGGIVRNAHGTGRNCPSAMQALFDYGEPACSCTPVIIESGNGYSHLALLSTENCCFLRGSPRTNRRIFAAFSCTCRRRKKKRPGGRTVSPSN